MALSTRRRRYLSGRGHARGWLEKLAPELVGEQNSIRSDQRSCWEPFSEPNRAVDRYPLAGASELGCSELLSSAFALVNASASKTLVSGGRPIVRAASALMTRLQRYAAGRLRAGLGGGSTLDRRAPPLPTAAGMGASGAWAPHYAHHQAALGLGPADDGSARRRRPEA